MYEKYSAAKRHCHKGWVHVIKNIVVFNPIQKVGRLCGDLFWISYLNFFLSVEKNELSKLFGNVFFFLILF